MVTVGTGIARLAADLTSEWLSAALGRQVTVASSAAVGTGQVAETRRLGLTEADGSTSSLIAKVASPDESSRAAGIMMRSYEVEVRCYETLVARIGTTVPRSHFAAVDPETGWFTLLLDDVAPAQTGDDLVGTSADVAAGALVELAALHAPTWQDADLAALPWLNRATPDSLAFTAGLCTSFTPGFLERYADRLSPACAGVIERFGPRAEPFYSQTTGPRAACHGDFRLDNMLFPADGGRPWIVDWQTTTWAHPATDVAYFLGGSVTPETRHAEGAALLSTYHEALGAGGVTDYPLAQLTHDVAAHSYGGIMMAVIAGMLVGQTERGDVMFTTAAERHAQQVLDLDAEALLP